MRYDSLQMGPYIIILLWIGNHTPERLDRFFGSDSGGLAACPGFIYIGFSYYPSLIPNLCRFRLDQSNCWCLVEILAERYVLIPIEFSPIHASSEMSNFDYLKGIYVPGSQGAVHSCK